MRTLATAKQHEKQCQSHNNQRGCANSLNTDLIRISTM